MLSVTMLTGFLYCRRKLYLERVLGLKVEVPPQQVLEGTIIHAAIEYTNVTERDLVCSIDKLETKEALEDKYKRWSMELLRKAILLNRREASELGLELLKLFRGLWPALEMHALDRAHNLFEFQSQTKLIGEGLWEALTPKIRAEVKVKAQKLGLVGVIDWLEKEGEEYTPHELKNATAPREGVWHDHMIQVAAYAMILSEAHGKVVGKGYVHYLKNGALRPVVVNAFLRDEVERLIRQVGDLVSGSQIPPYVENKKKCEKCPHKAICYDGEAIRKLLNEHQNI